MSLKIRLILSYVAMVVVPILLSIIATLLITLFFMRNINVDYKTKFNPNFYRQVMERSADIFTDIKLLSSKSPEKLEDKAYLSELDSTLISINTGIVVRKDNNIIYKSNILQDSNLGNDLPKFGSNAQERRGHMLESNDMSLIRQQDFYFPDKTPGSVFLVTDIAPVEKIFTRFFITLIAVIIGILILTDGVLSYLVSKSVLKPIETLKNAANKIKEGNLDFKIESCSKDEIGELCSNFEDMRCRLKESVDLQSQYENNRKELISNISHDLKTPITAIKGYVEGIMDGVADTPEKMDRYISTIYKKASDLDRLIDELFLFSKLDLNKLPFTFEKINIGNYMEDCVEELQFDLEEKGMEIIYDNKVLSRDTLVLADREKLKRVIINIVENAVKYSYKDNCKIEIKLSELEGNIKVEIKDNGRGVSEENLAQIFDRFYRADLSRNSTTGGSGLGLAISKLIIEEHGGKIWAQSELGLGTSIFFTLKTVE